MKSFPISLTLIAAAFTLAPLAILSTPASAQTAGDYRCTTLPAQVEAAAANATDTTARDNALRFLRTGNTLCQADADGAAARQFRSALRLLGVEEVRAPTATDIAQR